MKERLSNIEALRLLSMFTIVFYHLTDKAFEIHNDSVALGVFFNITHWGVPVFILISGYFFVRLTAKKLFSFYVQCVLWLFLSYFGSVALGFSDFSGSTLFCCLFPFSCTNLWLIKYYFFLMLLSPIINKGIEQLDVKTLYIINGTLLCSVLYFSLVWNMDVIAAGKSIYYFMVIYMTGASIRRLVELKIIDKIQMSRALEAGGDSCDGYSCNNHSTTPLSKITKRFMLVLCQPFVDG